MKKFLSTSFSIILAIIITYAGSGINTYSFCCEDCSTFGVEAFTEDKCCDVHHYSFSTNEHTDNETNCSKTLNHCSIERLDIDSNYITLKETLPQLSIKVLDILAPTLPYASKQETGIRASEKHIINSQIPPNMSKRVYFSLLEILII